MPAPTPGRILAVRKAVMPVRCDTCPTTIPTGTPLVRAAGGFTICPTCAIRRTPKRRTRP